MLWWPAEGEGRGAEAKGDCCCIMLGDTMPKEFPLPMDEMELRLLELWNTEELAEAGADDGVVTCGYDGRCR